MNMKTKEFNLEEAKAGAKVVTRDGKSVKIIYYDKKGNHPIVGLVDFGGTELAYSFTIEGKNSDSVYDLLLVEETQELTDFEDKLAEFLIGYLGSHCTAVCFTKQHSEELLEIAYKEFSKNLPKWKKINPRSIDVNDMIVFNNGYVLNISELDKLPKED